MFSITIFILTNITDILKLFCKMENYLVPKEVVTELCSHTKIALQTQVQCKSKNCLRETKTVIFLYKTQKP